MHISRDVVQDLLRQSELPAVLHDHLPVVLLMEAVIDCRRPPRVIIGDKHLVKNHVVVELDGKHILVPVDVEGQASFPSRSDMVHAEGYLWSIATLLACRIQGAQ